MSYIPSIYTVESVTKGHPDKMCDQVSDAVLDTCLAQDPYSRVAVECFGCNDTFIIGGEVTTNAEVDYEEVARATLEEIGYEHEMKYITLVNSQSNDIAQGVDTGGAGDQGIMYGYACNETPEFLPKGIVLAHRLTRGLDELRREVDWIKPDGKSQITIRDGKVEAVLVSTQHAVEIEQPEIRAFLKQHFIEPIVGRLSDSNIHINPTGRFVIGGFQGDTGLTGRKIMVDTYGGLIPHGGGAFSGKDATKVDRSAAYMARHSAQNLVERGLAKECLVSAAYAIGKSEPLMLEARDENGRVIKEIGEFDFSPEAIIEKLQLREPRFKKRAAYGHFLQSHV